MEAQKFGPLDAWTKAQMDANLLKTQLMQQGYSAAAATAMANRQANMDMIGNIIGTAGNLAGSAMS